MAGAADSQKECLPPGQRRVEFPPILHVGDVPKSDVVLWSLRVHGEVREPIEIGWSAFQLLPMRVLSCDMHGATGWSALDLTWTGVRLIDLAERARVKDSARFVRFKDADFYDTSLPREEALADDVLLAHLLGERTISRERGGPVRLVVPRKYAWKSVKWVAEIEFLKEDQAGFWERRGRPGGADPWREERGV